MNTIIPNELNSDFDLNDLPARVIQVSAEALSLSSGQSSFSNPCGGRGGSSCTYRTVYPYRASDAWSPCQGACSGTGLFATGKWFNAGDTGKIVCKCCPKGCS